MAVADTQRDLVPGLGQNSLLKENIVFEERSTTL
jgi:hypothetical protein